MVAPSGTLATSKSFRAILPGLAGDETDRLRRHCEANFAESAVFVDTPSSALVVWLATRDRTRTAAAHRRSARAVLARLRIPTAGLRGTWLVLATGEAVSAAAADRCPRSPSARAHADDEDVQPDIRAPLSGAFEAPAHQRARKATDDPDVKIVELGTGSCGRATQVRAEGLR